MLILSRKTGQSIVIGNDITITVKEVRGKSVKLSVETSSRLPIYRKEILDEIAQETKRAAMLVSSDQELPKGYQLVFDKGKHPKEEL